MSSRREFIRKAIAGSAGFIALGTSNTLGSILEPAAKKLTILHTNDMHSHIDPFPENDPKYPGLGGMGRRASLIDEIRKEEKNVLLLDAGDIFQGTPYFNEYGGELEFRLMSAMKYDAATLGNHDFDNGLDGLNKMLPFAKFPFVSANYDFSNTALAGKTKPYQIVHRGGLKIGIFGIGIQLEGLVDPLLYQETQYRDPLQIAAKTASTLKNEEKCDLVICLSHLGYQYDRQKVCDIDLAEQTRNVDIIIGGHTHTFLDEAQIFLNPDGKKVLVNQVGWAGVKLGRIDLYFNEKNEQKMASSASVFVTKNDAKNG